VDAAVQAGSCLNCGAVLSGAYCGQCGQKVPLPDPTLRELLHNAFEELTSWDGKTLHSLRTLVLRPGRLTVDFLAGRRARWLLPLRLYLICSLGYFVLISAIESLPDGAADQPRPTVTVTVSGKTVYREQLTPEQRAELKKSFFSRLVGPERLERALEHPSRLSQAFWGAMPKTMFLLLPLLALLVNLAYRRQVPRYPPHLYFALHVHALAFLVLSASSLIELVPWRWMQVWPKLAGYVFIAGYTVAALRAVYGGSRRATVARALAIGAVYLVCFALVAGGTVFVAFLTS
jgi:hypothetical protein